MGTAHEARRAALLDRLPAGVETVVVPPGPTLRYLGGYAFDQDAHGRDSPCLLVLAPGDPPAVLLPELAVGRARDAVDDAAVYPYPDPPSARDAFADLCRERDVTGPVGIEYRSTRLLEASIVESAVDGDIVDVGAAVHDLRARKDGVEVEALRTAGTITDAVVEGAIDAIEAGMTESDVERVLSRRAAESEADGLGVTMVATGERTAEIYPDGVDPEIARGDLVLIDTGVVYEGYYTDVTRTVAVGDVDEELRDAYGVVRRAARTAREAVRPGITCHDLDRTARAVVEDAGFGEAFVTDLGHGFGLEPHEPPTLAPGEETPLAAGHAVTVEPGVYLDGVGGIRIEDDVVVTENGAEVLTAAPRELRVL